MKIYIQEKDGSRTYTRKMKASAPKWAWISIDMDTATPLGWCMLEFTEDDLNLA